MGMRFRKSFKIAPGVKFNVNKKSVGMTFGGKGVHYTVNSSGRRTTSVGVPGTGLYYQSVSGGSGSSSNRQQTTRTRQIISDICPCCGTVNSKHEAFCPVCGQPLSEPVRQATPARYTAPPQYIPPQPVKVNKDHTNLIMLIVIIVICIGLWHWIGSVQDKYEQKTAKSNVEQQAQPSNDTLPSLQTAPESVYNAQVSNGNAQSDNSNAQADNSNAQADNSNAQADNSNVQSDNNKADMVWYVDGGSRYHRNSNCSNMENPKQISLDDAKKMGLTPCKRCY